MRDNVCTKMKLVSLLALGGLPGLCFYSTAHAQDRVMGQIRFIPSSKLLKTSGVWIDGQYVGYIDELKGGNQLRLLPGEHQVVVRQAGFFDLNRKVTIEPRTVADIQVNLDKDPRFTYPDPKTSSEVRFDVVPGRAAVFVDDMFVGYADEYYGFGRGMLVAPGKHRFKIALPGFRTLQTELYLYPRQRMLLRTDLVGGSIHDADPAMVNRPEPSSTSSAVNEATAPAVR